MKKQDFIKQYLPLAQKAGVQFGMNPVIILAQSAIETGWGESTLCKEHNNFFGITAYGHPNPFWKGDRTDLSAVTGRPTLWFRRYASPEDSFLDFARLVRNSYRTAWSKSDNPAAYAHEIAYSRYINELNGDDRETYRRSLIQIERTVQAVIQLTRDN